MSFRAQMGGARGDAQLLPPALTRCPRHGDCKAGGHRLLEPASGTVELGEGDVAAVGQASRATPVAISYRDQAM